MFIRIISNLSLIILVSCVPAKPKNITGSYISKTNRFFTKLLHPFDIIAGGNILEVRSDSTYYFEICSSYWTGTWRLENDSLILNPVKAVNKDSSEMILVRHAFFVKSNGELYRELLSEDQQKIIDILINKEK
jgi:hypothetical protein